MTTVRRGYRANRKYEKFLIHNYKNYVTYSSMPCNVIIDDDILNYERLCKKRTKIGSIEKG